METTFGSRATSTPVRLLRSVGYDFARVLQRHGAPPEILDAESLPAGLAGSWWREAQAVLSDPFVALHAGATLEEEPSQIDESILRTSVTLDEAFSRLTRINPLLGAWCDFRLRREPNVGIVSLTAKTLDLDAVAPLVEFAMAALIAQAERHTGGPIRPIAVRLTQRAPDDASEHEQVLGVVPHFGADENALVFAWSALQLPIATADAAARQLVDRLTDQLLRTLPQPARGGRDFLSDVRERVEQLIGEEDTSLERIARALGLSSRTLQRRLQEAGTSPQALFDDARRDVAHHYLLNTDLSIAEVAYRLGFSDVTAFHRAFKRWTGKTPGLIRSDWSLELATASRSALSPVVDEGQGEGQGQGSPAGRALPRAVSPGAVRLLLVEDDDLDAELVLAELEAAGFKVASRRVDTERDLLDALRSESWDIIISDYSMPGFDGIRALACVLEHQPQTPFLFVSGVLGEELAVEAMRGGARDLLLKGKLGRLSSAVRRELAEAQHKRLRVAAETALENETRRYHNVFEHAGVALIELDLAGVKAWLDLHPTGAVDLLRSDEAQTLDLARSVRIVDVNGEAVRLLGAGRREELLGPVSGEFLRMLRGSALQLTRAVAERSKRVQIELSGETPDGKTRRSLATINFSETDDEWSSIVLSLVDITERRALEDQMRAAQRLEAVGRLAGGVAHDFANLLSVIGSYAGFLHDSLTGTQREDAQVLLDATKRGASITRQLLAFSRQDVCEVSDVAVGPAMRELEKLLARFIGEDVQLVVDVVSQPLYVRIDPTHLEQVVMNLAVNARDALPRGGRIGISVAPVLLSAGDPQLTAWGAAPGSFVRLTVADNGIGMDEATRLRVFEPFFTTKEYGKGTGLGLSTAYGIVKQAGGVISIDSEVGRGTTFEVLLPGIAPPKIPDRVGAASPRLPTVPAGSTVLVVEDQEMLRRTITRLLVRSGLTVIEAATAEEALDLFERAPVDLLLTDLLLPHMTGTELADRLLAMRPGLRVLLMSGQSGDLTMRFGTDMPDRPFIPKPFTALQLLERISDVFCETS